MAAISKDEPLLKEVLKVYERPDWIKTIEAKLSQIERLHTWDLVEAPPETNIMLCIPPKR
jgi:hypothetical protein